jgi:hypothetical protein
MAEHQALLLPTEEALLKTTTVVIIQTEDQATQLPQPEAITIIATTTHQEAIHHQPLPVHTTIAAVVEVRDRLAVAVVEDHTVAVEAEEDNIVLSTSIKLSKT